VPHVELEHLLYLYSTLLCIIIYSVSTEYWPRADADQSSRFITTDMHVKLMPGLNHWSLLPLLMSIL
jgi:hypothetical protein